MDNKSKVKIQEPAQTNPSLVKELEGKGNASSVSKVARTAPEENKQASLNPSQVFKASESRVTHVKQQIFGSDKDNILEQSGILLAYQGTL